MYVFKIFRLNERQIVIQTPSDFYNSVPIPQGIMYLNNDDLVGIGTYIGVPDSGMRIFSVINEIEVCDYVKILQNRFQNHLDVEIQYTDLIEEINNIPNVTFIKRNVGVFTFSRSGSPFGTYSNIQNNDLCTLKNLNEGRLKIFNI